MSPERMNGTSSVEIGWQFVVDTLHQATADTITLTEEEEELLRQDFWTNHADILKKYEADTPGITEQVFELFEQLGQGKRAAASAHFEKVTFPKAKRQAFIRGLLGRQALPLDKLLEDFDN